MKSSIHSLVQGVVLAASCIAPWAMAANCEWNTGGPAMMSYQRDMGTLYVPRDARVGAVIGGIDLYRSTPNNAGLTAECSNDGNHNLEFNARATAPIFPGPLDPINGEDVTGKILQTNIPGVGVRIKLGIPLNGVGDNSFVPNGPPTVPYDAFNNMRLLIPIRLNSLANRLTLVKTGPIDPGQHTLDGRELFSGHLSDLGKVFSFGMIGTIVQAQCTVDALPPGSDPVQLGDWDAADFTHTGFTTQAMPFSIRLSACVTDPGSGFIATANIQLDGVKGSMPIGPTSNGVFSLTSDSAAEGMGIQILKADGTTPVELSKEMPVIAISPGSTSLDFSARFYQTEPADAIRPGLAKGALSFTITYK
ncbi:MAG: type 1 fimbrial protein [Pseudomonadales bacterium]|jgi:type 1 fimbria pilin|nr:type 1 fimbrial protein [Pseudomonadales bacterium]